MGIECITPISEFEAYMQRVAQIMEGEVLRTLAYLGEQCIKRIRDRNGETSWFDQTGNLRSSIGYGIFDHGKKFIESSFQQIANGLEGVSKGRKMLDSLADQYTQTYTLVVVAGMEYAEYVEAMKNKDVLASTELWAKQQVERYIKQAIERAIRKINAL